MTSAASATEAAAFAALEAGLTLAAVHQHVPQDTPPPIVVVGDIELQRLSGKDASRDRKGVLTVGVLYEGEERKPLLAIQEEVEAALDGLVAERDGWTLAFAYADDGQARDQENVELYAGMSRFEVLALHEGTVLDDDLGPELIVNGDASDPSGMPWVFDEDTGLGMTSVQNGRFVGSDLEEYGLGGMYQFLELEDGATYRAAFTIDSISGGFLSIMRGTARRAPGTYIEDIVVDVSDRFSMYYETFTTVRWGGISLRKVEGIAISLGALSWAGPASVPENTFHNQPVQSISGKTPGSALLLVDDAGGRFTFDGYGVRVAGVLDHEQGSSYDIILRETLGSAINSPRDTVLTITVTDVVE